MVLPHLLWRRQIDQMLDVRDGKTISVNKLASEIMTPALPSMSKTCFAFPIPANHTAGSNSLYPEYASTRRYPASIRRPRIPYSP